SAPEVAEVAVVATEAIVEAPAWETPTEVASIDTETAPVEAAAVEAMPSEGPKAESAVRSTPEVFPQPAEIAVAPVPESEEVTSPPEQASSPAETAAPWPGGPADVPVVAETAVPADDEVIAALQTLMPQTASLEPPNGRPKAEVPTSGFAAALAAAD